MDGAFNSDITRDTYKSTKHFSRVIRQQGRVDLDADWNELVDIFLHYQRTAMSDIIGPHAGPAALPGSVDQSGGFAVEKWTPENPTKADADKDDTQDDDRDERRKKKSKKPQPQQSQDDGAYKVIIGEGRYYVDGILCECDRERYIFLLEDENRPSTEGIVPLLYYLDVWEREVTAFEDDSIREVALGGPDTATRSIVEWRIRVFNLLKLNGDQQERLIWNPNAEGAADTRAKTYNEEVTEFVRTYAPDFDFSPHRQASLKARTEKSEQDYTDPCVTPPSSQYRGAENQLYRVEIHRSGTAYPNRGTGQATPSKGERRTNDLENTATFVWSRENGSVVFPIVGPISGGSTITLTIEDLGRDDSRYTLRQDDWVEIVDVEEVVEGDAGPLLQVVSIDRSTLQVTLKPYQGEVTFDNDDIGQVRPRVLRRWDYQRGDPSQKGALELADDGAAKLVENSWLTLEDGIQVLFHSDYDNDRDADDTQGPVKYRTGDYWLIPARTARGDIEWPQQGKGHLALPPHGVTHHYAPLAIVHMDNKGAISKIDDLRRVIDQIWAPRPL